MANETAKRGNDGDIHPHDSPKRANTNMDDEMEEAEWNDEDRSHEFTKEEIEAAKNTHSDDEMDELNDELSTQIDSNNEEIVTIGGSNTKKKQKYTYK